jgi:hypothetical protein
MISLSYSQVSGKLLRGKVAECQEMSQIYLEMHSRNNARWNKKQWFLTVSPCIRWPENSTKKVFWTASGPVLDCVWNVMAHAQKPDFVFRRNERVHLNRQERQFSGLLAAEVCESAVVILDTPCSEVVWRVLATHSIRQFSLHSPSRASPCAITFQLDSTTSPLV